MRKVLSLKKQTLASKNQKPITQFFKNTNVEACDASRNHQNSHEPVEMNIRNSAQKRKASSMQDQLRHNTDINSCSILMNSIGDDEQYEKKDKKIKLETKNQQSPLKNGFGNKTLQSTQKENKEVCIVEYEEKGNTVSPIQDNKKNRSPLIPTTCENESPDKSGKQTSKLSPVKSQDDHAMKSSTPQNSESENKQSVSYIQSPKKVSTPKKSPTTVLRRSPRIAKLLTPEKKIEQLSPKKSSTIKELVFDDVGEVFGDDWEINDIEECSQDADDDLDLSAMQRCEILAVTNHPTRIELKLKNASNNRGTCFVEGFWQDTPLYPGDILSVIASRQSSGQFCVNNTSGLLVLRPDHLVSSTSVVAGVFCKRKAVLQERWRGIDSANTSMTLGILIHELVQKALTQNITDIKQINIEVDKIIKESIQMLYDAGLSEEEVHNNMQVYIPPLAEFMQTYVAGKPSNGAVHKNKDRWKGHINKVMDIEENLCCPQLGLKGKIDATLQVTIHDKKGSKNAIVPLELKSGKASMSAEHRGQLVLYGMMISLQQKEDPTQSDQRGLLLYLKDRVELREVSCGYPERRDLVTLRNQLVQSLAASPHDVDPESLVDIEDASILLQQKLPDPINRENICSKCPYLTLCSLHLWHTDGPTVSENHPLATMQGAALGHLSGEHIKYFLRWTALLKMEERVQALGSPLHSLWTDAVEKRQKRGTCAANLLLKSIEGSGDRFLHVFRRNGENTDGNPELRGPQEGEFSIVSIDNRPWIAAGVVVLSKEKEIHILLERDLSRRLAKSTLFHVDTYESYATTVQNLTNLGVLLEDSDRAQRLRSLIIDKDPPEFEAKLPREVSRLGTKLMRSLNIQQQRGVLRALASKHYALLQGLPGTGKTQTISVLIQMLVGLKQRVLVTAHTHSAVDTVLSRLPNSIRVMRLGSKSRVAKGLVHRCEEHLVASCENVQQLEKLYDSMEVVGVTCLGAAHAMLAKTSFDMCIVDEATQVLQSTVLRPLFAAKRFVLVGDPEQLPPVVRSRAARRLGMEESLFHRLMSDESTSTLQLQYRMNEPLAEVANCVAYNKRLKCADKKVADARLNVDVEKISQKLSQSSWLLTAVSAEANHAAVFLDLQAEPNKENSKSCVNRREACLVLALVEALLEGGIKSSDIGVIAPYRDQVSLLRRSLSGRGDASTVDQFQGRDKPVIIYSCTRSDVKSDDRKVKEGEVLNDQRRLAVSVTRAKLKLIVVGDSRALRRYAPLQRLIDACAGVTLSKQDIDFLDTYKNRVIG